MKTSITFISVALMFLFTATNAQTINSEKSKVTFEIGNMKVNTVPGSFTGMKGDIMFNQDDLSNSGFKVCIESSTVDTGNKKRDDHLRNEDFFHVEKYPEICFESESVSKFQDNYVAKGRLSMHGETKDVLLPFTFDGKIFKGAFKLYRLDFGVGEGTSEFTVSNEVSLTVECVVE